MSKKNKLVSLLVICFCLIGGTIYLYEYRINSNIIEEVAQIKEHDIVFGDIEVQNSIIVYFNYNCSFCQKFAKEVYPKLDSAYIASKRVKVILRLVCSIFDKKAMEAYQTVYCISEFGNLQPLHKLLLHNNKIIYSEHFQTLIDGYINTNSNVAECVIMHEDYKKIKINIEDLNELNSQGTPTFLINKEVIKGYKTFDEFESLLKNK
ncbi:MAG: DsbA family protein [Marinilabiliaceae bacterium]|nr:DsbA family protein [Marinilabiliaceae bacterium]